MFLPIPNGSEVVIEGVTCYIPPVGYGCHTETGELESVEILKRSNKASEQYWERPKLPADFEKKVRIEKKKQEIDPSYSDSTLDSIRVREWRRRLYGIWFWNNGEYTYITGLHYFYLTYWYLATGYPDYRVIDWEKAIFWQVVVEDPEATAMIEVRKRRDGKSFFAGCMLFEAMSRTKGTIEGGIISLNETEAYEFFSKTIVSPFKKLASLFVPIWDTSSTLKKDLRFTKPSVKGKNNSTMSSGDDNEELGSYITFLDSKVKAYDGHQLKRLVVDEFFKTEVDCFARDITVKYCAMDHTGKVVGKILYTSTVEEIGVKFRGDKFWAANDQLRRLPVADSVKRSGKIYCFFMPSYRSGPYDIYGKGNDEKEKARIKRNQEHLRNSERDLIADMRKNPFDVIQAFRITSNKCHFDQTRLFDRVDEIGWADVIQRGDFTWENAVPLTEVTFTPSKSGKIYLCKGFKFDNEKDRNNVLKRGNSYMPGNTTKYVLGLDPYDHDVTEDNRRSDAAFYVYKKNNPMMPEDPYGNAFVMEYIDRPATAALMYDEVMKASFYFGCQVLFESQKTGVRTFFRNKDCGAFMIHLDGYKDAGIPSSPENKRTGVDIIEEYILKNLDKVYFKRLLLDWSKFDLNNTQKYDATMGSMWTLYADRYKIVKREVTDIRPITDYFRKYKTA